mmetsp:Transcript_30872/g.55943  ORF Transcript_30872/g.55943 Transcript_30872/m.55943 type:complete len:255 (+) Transcript_30872:1324-2088(+)
MYNKLPIRRLRLHNQIRIPVKFLQQLQRSQLPRFIHRLHSQQGRMIMIPIHYPFNHLQRMLNIIVIDRSIIDLVGIKFAHPIRRSDGPVLERRQIARIGAQTGRPLKSHGLTRVVKAILGIFLGVYVEEDGEAVGVGPVEEGVEIIEGSVGAPDIRTIRLKHKIPHRHPQRIHRPTPRQLLHNILRHPTLPMPPQLLIPLLRPQNFAERVMIHSRLSHSSPKKLIEERRSDPRFENHPSTEVHAAYLIVEREGV